MAKTSAKEIEREMRLSRLLAKRVTGMSLRQIGQEESPAISLQAVAQLISRGVSEMVVEPLDQIRRLELFRLDKLQSAIWPAAMLGDIAAIDRVLACMTRRARLLGLDLQRPSLFSDRDGEEIDPSTIKVEIIGDPQRAKMEWLEQRVRELESGIAPTEPPSTTLN